MTDVVNIQRVDCVFVCVCLCVCACVQMHACVCMRTHVHALLKFECCCSNP